MTGFAERLRLRHLIDLLWVLVARDLKLRYKRSILGLLWTIVNPLSQLLVFHFVFGRLFKVDIPHFAVYLFVGIVVWTWFSSSLIQATTVFIENRPLLGRPGFPTALLPVATVGSHLVHFLLTLPIIFMLMWIEGVAMGPAAIALPLLIVLQLAMILGMAYVLASLQVAFHDTQYLLSLALMLWFYLTPIFYSVELVPEAFLPIYRLNPMAHMVDAYRLALIAGVLPSAGSLLTLVGFSLVSLVVGYRVHRRLRHSFLRHL